MVCVCVGGAGVCVGGGDLIVGGPFAFRLLRVLAMMLLPQFLDLLDPARQRQLRTGQRRVSARRLCYQ